MSGEPMALEAPQAAMIKTLWLGNLVIFALAGGGAFFLVSPFSAFSVLVGSALALLNFRLLERTVRKALLSGNKEGIVALVLIKNGLRFLGTALLLWILVRQGWAEPLGLLAGLSVVVASVMLFGMIQARKLMKEGF